jgi:WD40 repeat protein
MSGSDRNSKNKNNKPATRYIPGQGTHNRPWILDDIEDDIVTSSSYDRYLAQRQSQQEQQQKQLRQQRVISREVAPEESSRTSTNINSRNSRHFPDHPRVIAASSTSMGSEITKKNDLLLRPRPRQKQQHQRRSSAPGSPIASYEHISYISPQHSRDELPRVGNKTLTLPKQNSADLKSHARMANDLSLEFSKIDIAPAPVRLRSTTSSYDKEDSTTNNSYQSTRELRASRLLQQQQIRRKNEAQLQQFPAHDDAVEQYLRRKEALRQPPTNIPPRNAGAVEPRQSAFSNASANPAALKSSTLPLKKATLRSNVMPSTVRLQAASEQQLQTEAQPTINNSDAVDSVEMSNNTTATSTGWSTLKRASTTGNTSMTVEALSRYDHYQLELEKQSQNAETRSSSGSIKVDEYLAQRHALKQRAGALVRLGKRNNHVVASAPVSAPLLLEEESSSISENHGQTEHSTSIVKHSHEDEDSGDSGTDVSSDYHKRAPECGTSNKDFSDDDENDPKSWSVRVCVVSAVDFPASVVPNLPLSPFLKVGLVHLTALEADSNEKSSGNVSDKGTLKQSCDRVKSLIGRDGLLAVAKSHVRCTSTKILSRRDNGSVEFHEEMRWNGIKNPQQMALALELSSRGVLTPANAKESPPAQEVTPFQLPVSPHQSSEQGSIVSRKSPSSLSDSAAHGASSGLGLLFRKIRKSDSAEMEEANAAAAVAQLLVQTDGWNPGNKQTETWRSTNEIDVKLRPRKRKKKSMMSEELHLGSQVIPLVQLPLSNALSGFGTARVEHWFDLESSKANPTSTIGQSQLSSTATRNPSILLEVSFAASENLDDSEDDMEEDDDGTAEIKASYSKRASLKIRNQLKQEIKPEDVKIHEPELEPGVIDYICVVGARDIGNQKADDGGRGWVNSTPECRILERFPPSDEYHLKNGRSALLPGKVEWFCLPEGCRLWRGTTPPNHEELNLRRFSAASPSHVSTSVASFDAFLGCTTSFSWFVIASNSDEYGSDTVKTYGAAIRFYVPAPMGIDPTQDDFAQTKKDSLVGLSAENGDGKRLWVPIAICLTSSFPIVGVMEMMLLRLCEKLSSINPFSLQQSKTLIATLASLIIHCQKPIPGVVNCSIPFIDGERLHVAMPSRKGLPALPHGNSVASVCRLLGADGLNYILAALLTECKILLHSDEVSNLCLVAEVMTALLYPFQWSLPYIPVLPLEMMEFIEAPLSYLLGVPSCNISLIDPSVLEDVVVIDLDHDFSSSDYNEGRRNGMKTKSPVPVPAATASNISKAVHRLLKAEDEVDSFGSADFPFTGKLPRLEQESLPEREFRISVALEICNLIRGYDDCLVFSSSQPVFNVEKFLQVAPAIFEEHRAPVHGPNTEQATMRRVISPRSRRFVSLLVCCQHFHQFLAMLESDSLTFFHQVKRSIECKSAKKDSSLAGRLLSLDTDHSVDDLCKMLQNFEDQIPTYRVQNYENIWTSCIDEASHGIEKINTENLVFPHDLLQPIVVERERHLLAQVSDGVKHVSLEYLVKLEKNPWRYSEFLSISNVCAFNQIGTPKVDKIKLKDAIGERRYRLWKTSAGYERLDGDEASILSEESRGMVAPLDLKLLLSAASEDLGHAKLSTIEIKDCDAVRFCLETAVSPIASFDELLVAEAEQALQNPRARDFLLAVLSKRNRPGGESFQGKRRSVQAGASKLDARNFQILARLASEMLDISMDICDYKSAYSMLKHSAGLQMMTIDNENETITTYLSERIGSHPIFADLELWYMVKNLHAKNRRLHKGPEKFDEKEEEYEAVVGTIYEMNGYGIPAEELARFGSRMCVENGWFGTERGQNLLLLVRRISHRRELGHASIPSRKSDLEISIQKNGEKSPRNQCRESSRQDFCNSWTEISWCHPAARSSRRASTAEGTKLYSSEIRQRLKRSPITSMAYLGSSVVVTGGLDGGVFMARKAKPTRQSSPQLENCDVRGVHLDWGSSGSRYSAASVATSSSLDGEYGVGAVTCLAATRSMVSQPFRGSTSKDVIDYCEDEELLRAVDGSRVVAGTTCGDLRVWSVKDVFAAVFYASSGGDTSKFSLADNCGQIQSAGGSTSTSITRRRGTADFAAGSSLTRLKFSLRGRALSGHRGGVSCIEVHSNVYRPDSIVTGGADGLIKLWNLKAPTGGAGGRRSSSDASSNGTHMVAVDGALGSKAKAPRSGDALSILSGHGGRILCLKAAWHGDRILSGGADRTVRLWDVSGSGGKCLNTLTGHFGWVTSVHLWGPNTVISSSTDRSVALWDARVRSTPLFTLRFHCAPVSNILVGARTDPVIYSSSIDGTVAAWDLRHLPSTEGISQEGIRKYQCEVARNPTGMLYFRRVSHLRNVLGPVHLLKGGSSRPQSVLCVGSDAVIREWHHSTGDVLSEHVTGHCDAISTFVALDGDQFFDSHVGSSRPTVSSTITTSWDGTIRMRTLNLKES